MELHQFRTDGKIDVTPLRLSDVQGAKWAAMELVAYPEESGIYRIRFVDAEYDRDVWDTYRPVMIAPSFGTLAFAGVS